MLNNSFSYDIFVDNEQVYQRADLLPTNDNICHFIKISTVWLNAQLQYCSCAFQFIQAHLMYL